MQSPGRLVAILAVLALAGCGAGDKKDDGPRPLRATAVASIEVAPADGKTLETDDFSYAVPKGWAEANDAVPTAVSVARDGRDDDGFVDNVNVIRLDPAPILDLTDLEDASVAELEGLDARSIRLLPRHDVDGSEGLHISAELAAAETSYVIEQFNVIHDGTAYVVTFSFSPTVKEKQRLGLSQSVLMTWEWSD